MQSMKTIQYFLQERKASFELSSIQKRETSRIQTCSNTFLLHERMQAILDDENKGNCLIYAPCQVGKTNASITMMTECIKKGYLIVYSTDNKTDQMDQADFRISNEIKVKLNHMNVSVICMSNVTEKRFKSMLKKNVEQKIPTVVLIMDNDSQIQKLRERFVVLDNDKNIIPPVALFHDEGDIITKDEDVHHIHSKQATSHKAWLQFTNFFSLKNNCLKRIFVTATPENVVYKYRISDVIDLEVPSNYQGFESIDYQVLQNENIPTIFRSEIAYKRHHGENGIILYNIERVREGRGKKKEVGQDVALANVIEHCSDVVCSVYNGDGITVYLPSQYRVPFETQIKQYNNTKTKKSHLVKYTLIETDEHIDHLFQLKNVSIGWFYQFCKNIGVDIVVTIGCDLMNRGISFCSIKKEPNALAATTMIYRPNSQRHGVGIVQTVGRICGTCRPDLKRTLYAPKPIIEKYKAMCENQKDFIPALQKELEEKPQMDSEKFFQEFALKRALKGHIDRPNLKLKPQFRKEESVDQQGFIDGVDLEKLRKLCNAQLVVSKMIRYLMDQNGPINMQQFKEGIEYEPSDDKFIPHLKNGYALGSQYGMLWNCRNNNQEIVMNPKIRQYILDNSL